VFVHSVVIIVVLVAVLGAAASVAGSTWSALVPRIVGEDHVAEAVSAVQSLNALVAVGAPAVGGLLAGAFGTGLPLVVDAATFVVVTVASALVRTRRTPAALGSDGRPAVARGGFEILRADPVLAPLIIGLVVLVLLVGMVDVVLVFLIRATLHAGGAWYGVAQTAWIGGIVAGSLGAGRLRTERVQTWATIAGAGVACAALAPFAVVPAVWMLVPLSVLGGTGNGYANVCASTLFVTRTPDANGAGYPPLPTPPSAGPRVSHCWPAERSPPCSAPGRSTPWPDCSAWPSRSPSPSSTPPGRPEPASTCSLGPKNSSATDLSRPAAKGTRRNPAQATADA
jgi:hypothetical protein